MIRPPWWGSPEKVSPRLVIEVQQMKLYFGSTFKLLLPEPGGTLRWEGEVNINMAELSKDKRLHTVKLIHPSSYPREAPIVIYPGLELEPDTPHSISGKPCLYNPVDGRNHGWNPSKSTAATTAGWAIQWLYAYYTWRTTGNWPGEEETVAQREMDPLFGSKTRRHF